MAQEITAIITNQDLEIDQAIVHFKEQACTIIPLEIHPSHIEYFVSQAVHFERLEDFLNYLENSTDWNIEAWCNPDDEFDNRHSMKTLINRIRSMKLDNFIIEHFSDFGSNPTDGYFIAVIDGEIRKESAMSSAEGLAPNSVYEQCRKLMDLNHYWFTNEDRYHSYHHAEESYRKSMGD